MAVAGKRPVKSEKMDPSRSSEGPGLEYCSGKLGRLVVAELLDADSW